MASNPEPFNLKATEPTVAPLMTYGSIFTLVVLVGGSEGNVLIKNRRTGIIGPVPGESWTLENVRLKNVTALKALFFDCTDCTEIHILGRNSLSCSRLG